MFMEFAQSDALRSAQLMPRGGRAAIWRFLNLLIGWVVCVTTRCGNLYD